METQDYVIAWIVYLVAAGAMSIISWGVLKKFLWRELAYLLQGLLMAIMFTPWYVLPDDEILAPAIIIFVLDLVTIDVTTSIRALIPLVMAMLLALIVAVVMGVVYRIRRRRKVS